MNGMVQPAPCVAQTSISEIEDIRQSAERITCALEKSGLKGGYEQLKGKRYEFTRMVGSVPNRWTGTIDEVRITEDGFLELLVSDKRFHGIPIQSFVYTDKGWCVRLDVPGQEYPGELRFS